MFYIVVDNQLHIMMCLSNLKVFHFDRRSTKSISRRTSTKQGITKLNRKGCNS